tara:strand:+ start:17425 stop:18183 length:759 start_codon:yes stop_codon:yes gene_type:complete
MDEAQLKKHQLAHSADAIQSRLLEPDKGHYLKDALLGSMDGCVTCFALICGIYGAGYGYSVAIILGLASLFADGFSMATSNYFSTKSEQDKTNQLAKEEEKHIQIYPEGEKEEIRQIYFQKGFSGDILEQIVETITQDKKAWIETMLKEDHGLSLNYANPIISGLVTMVAFVVLGIFPLIPLIFANNLNSVPFYLITLFTGIAFCTIGTVKAIAIKESITKCILETLFVGAIAAIVAYSVSYYLKHYLLVGI